MDTGLLAIAGLGRRRARLALTSLHMSLLLGAFRASRSRRFRTRLLFTWLAPAAFRIQQQRLLALRDACERCRDLDRRNVVLALEPLDERTKRLAFTGRERVADPRVEARDALIVHVLDGRQLHALDRLTGRTFDH